MFLLISKQFLWFSRPQVFTVVRID